MIQDKKNNVLLKLIKHQRPDMNKIYLYIKDPFKSKYQLLINGREKVEIKTLKNSEAFIDYSQVSHRRWCGIVGLWKKIRN